MLRTAPTNVDLLEALAGAIAASDSHAQALGLVATAGPSSARTARRIQDELARSKGNLAQALFASGLLGADEASAASSSETSGQVAAALEWIVGSRRALAFRRRAITGAITGPLALAAIMLLTEPIPSIILGGGSVWPALRHVAFLCAATAGVLFGIPKLLSHRLAGPRIRSLCARLPFFKALIRLEEEEATAAVIAAFSDAGDVGVLPAPFTDMLKLSSEDALIRAPSLSETFGLTLAVGVRSKDLPTRFAAFHRAKSEALTNRLRLIARVIAFSVAGAVALQGATKMLSGTLPGIGGDLGSSPELKQLERELDNALH